MSFPLKFYNLIVPEKRLSYSCWWNKPIDAYDKNFWHSDSNPVRHGQFVVNFYNNLKKILEKNKYVIKDEKRFKREIATFIYQLSSERV